MLKTSQAHTGSSCWIFHSLRSLRFSRRYSFALRPALALLSSMDQKMLHGSRSPCPTSTPPVFVLCVSFFSLIPAFNDLEHKGHMFMDPWPRFDDRNERGREGHWLVLESSASKVLFVLSSVHTHQQSSEQEP